MPVKKKRPRPGLCYCGHMNSKHDMESRSKKCMSRVLT